MKKHELLKFAYDNFPKGTVARFKSAPNNTHISCGSFILTYDKDNGTCVSSESDQSNCFYCSKDSMTQQEIEEWAYVDKKPKQIEIYDKSEIIGTVDINGFESRYVVAYKLSTESIEDIYKASQKLIAEYK